MSDIWRVDPTMLSPGHSSRREEDSVDMPVTDEDYVFLMKTNDLISTHVDLKRMIEPALYVFQETTLDCCIEARVETQVVSSLETTKREVAKGKKTPI